MAVTAYTQAGVQRRVFRNLLLLWGLFLIVAFVFIALTVPLAGAQAMEPLPLPKVSREIVAPQFTSFSKVPSPGVKADGCQALLKGARSNSASTTPTRRTAAAPFLSSSPEMAKIKAIQAYRSCKSRTALDQLAAWRWSR